MDRPADFEHKMMRHPPGYETKVGGVLLSVDGVRAPVATAPACRALVGHRREW